MPAATYNLTIEQGATFSLPFTVADSSGTPINFSGITTKMDSRPTDMLVIDFDNLLK
jgi:hypothetical protein